MQCRSCRNILPDNTETCPFCGASPSAAFSEFSSYEDDADAGSVRYTPFTQITQTQPGVASGVASDGQPAAGSQWGGMPSSYTHPGFYGNGQRLPGGELPLALAPEQKFEAPPVRRGGLSPPVVVLLIVLALCLGIGGTLVYISVGHHAQDQASGGTQTNGGNSTSNPAQQTKTLDTSNVQLLYTQATSGTPVFTADSSTVWTTLGSSDKCVFSGTALQVSSSGQFAGCLVTSASFDNFAFQANVTFVQAKFAALAFRANMINRSLYMFAISSNGVYVLESDSSNDLSGTNAKILAGGTSSAIKTGTNQPNLMTVIALGSSIYLYINQQYVTTVNDTLSNSGAIALAAGATNSNPINARFGDIRVWQL